MYFKNTHMHVKSFRTNFVIHKHKVQLLKLKKQLCGNVYNTSISIIFYRHIKIFYAPTILYAKTAIKAHVGVPIKRQTQAFTNRTFKEYTGDLPVNYSDVFIFDLGIYLCSHTSANTYFSSLMCRFFIYHIRKKKCVL